MDKKESGEKTEGEKPKRKRIPCLTPPRTPRSSPPRRSTPRNSPPRSLPINNVNFSPMNNTNTTFESLVPSSEEIQDFCRWCSDALPNEVRDVLGAVPQNLESVTEYKYTTGEAFANFITHFLCIPGAALAFYKLLNATNTYRETMVVSIYGSLLMALFLISTLYHFVFMLEIWHSCVIFCHRIRPWRRFMLMMDRSVVHLFIAGCYTPWLILRDNGPLGSYMCQAMWLATISGIVIQHAKLISRNDRLIFLYLLVGIIPGTFMIVSMTDSSGLPLIGIGGLAYLVGLLFFFSDGRVPYAHAIWHCFVIIGVYLHYRAMVDYLLRERKELPPPSMANRLFAGVIGFFAYLGNFLLRPTAGAAARC